MGSSVILPPQGQPGKGPDPSFKTAKYANVVTFGFDKVGPPSPLYVQRDDQLLLEAAGSAIDTVFFNIRMLYPPFSQGGQPDSAPPGQDPGQVVFQGIIEPGTDVVILPVAQANNLVSITRNLMEGYLLAVSCICLTSRSRGIVFARASLIRGTQGTIGQPTFQALFADYPTSNHAVGWPGGRVVYPTEGPGAIVTRTQGNPAAGADILVQPADALRWRVQALKATLTTSASAGNRQVHVTVSDSLGNIFWNSVALGTQAASLAVQYTFGPGMTPQTTTDGVQLVGLPANLIMAQRHAIQTVTTGLLAGDQWSAIVIGVEQWEDLI